jgi:hypothetical protein
MDVSSEKSGTAPLVQRAPTRGEDARTTRFCRKSTGQIFALVVFFTVRPPPAAAREITSSESAAASPATGARPSRSHCARRANPMSETRRRRCDPGDPSRALSNRATWRPLAGSSHRLRWPRPSRAGCSGSVIQETRKRASSPKHESPSTFIPRRPIVVRNRPPPFSATPKAHHDPHPPRAKTSLPAKRLRRAHPRGRTPTVRIALPWTRAHHTHLCPAAWMSSELGAVRTGSPKPSASARRPG